MGEPSIYRRRNEATEKGYSAKLSKAILGKEQEIRLNKDESLYFYNSKGELLASLQGKGTSVNAGKDFVAPTNAIMVHNHPSALDKTGIKRIGNSFSGIDMVSAVRYNAREMRAVTPTYTFSMKRPKGGWGATPEEVRRVYQRYNEQVRYDFTRYVDRRGYSETAQRRAEVMHWHRVNQLVSKYFGWKYTKKNK